MRLKAHESITEIPRSISCRRERDVGEALECLLVRQHPRCVSMLLIRRAVCGHPLRDQAFFFGVSRQLSSAYFVMLLRARAKIRTKPPIRLRRYGSGQAEIAFGVEEHGVMRTRHIAVPGRGLRMFERTKRRIGEESFGQLLVRLEANLAALPLALRPLG